MQDGNVVEVVEDAEDEAVEADEVDAAEKSERSRPRDVLVVLDGKPESSPARGRGAGGGSGEGGSGRSRVKGPKGLTKLLLPIVQDTDKWSVDGTGDVWVLVREYDNGTGAKGAIKNLAAHPEKLPVHDGAELDGDVAWEFAATLHYFDGDGVEVVAGEDGTYPEGVEVTRGSRLSAKYGVSADAYLAVAGRGGGEPTVTTDDDADETVDEDADPTWEDIDADE